MLHLDRNVRRAIFTLCCLSFFLPNTGYSATRLPRGAVVVSSASELRPIRVNYKRRSISLYCRGEKPGVRQRINRQTVFVPLSTSLNFTSFKLTRAQKADVIELASQKCAPAPLPTTTTTTTTMTTTTTLPPPPPPTTTTTSTVTTTLRPSTTTTSTVTTTTVKPPTTTTTTVTTTTIKPTTTTVTTTSTSTTRTTTTSSTTTSSSTTTTQPQVPTPDSLSLSAYTGNFGETEARILFDRFGFGASPERVALAVQDGLATTVTKLTTWEKEDSTGSYPYNLDQIVFDWGCDMWIAGDSGDGQDYTCNPSNPYDFHKAALPTSRLIKFLFSPNQYFYKMVLFLHDERMTGSNLPNDTWFTRRMILEHWNMLLNAAKSGDFKQFMRDWTKDTMGHVIWLDGEDNLKWSPNQNFAREFWELGTVGSVNIAGHPNYTSEDVAAAALAFTGWSRGDAPDAKGPNWVGVFRQQDHASGSFVIFQGTPYQATVSMPEDVLLATFNHPGTAESLAEEIWKNFINPFPDAAAIQQLAQLIRNSNYNLTPVMRTVMKSKAMFATDSRESLIKNPIELVIGFLRSLPNFTPEHIHYGDDYTVLGWNTGELGQSFLNGSTVFGWDEKLLTGAAYVKSWRDVSNFLVHETPGSYARYMEPGYGGSFEQVPHQTNGKYPLRSRLMDGLSNSDQVVDRASKWLNVPLNTAQRNLLKTYLDSRPRPCTAQTQSQPQCQNGGKFYTQVSSIMSNPSERIERLKGLLSIIMNQPSYRTK